MKWRPDPECKERSVGVRVAGLALLQVGLSLVLGWILADVAVTKLISRQSVSLDEIGLPERSLAALCAFVAASGALMVAHIATGGAVFGTTWVVPLVALAVIAIGIRKRIRPRKVPLLSLTIAVVLLFAFFVLPVIRGGTAVRTGDTPWHLGWSEQLLSGEPVPTGPAPEYGKNAYPWGFHAVVATMVRLVPGSDPLIAHEALHVLLVLAIPLAACCIARRMDRRAGWAAAAAAAFIGGWGWLSAQDPYFILSPSLARYGADLVVASPNSVYELFPPALPRELGLVLLAAGGAAISMATEAARRRLLILAGGLVGLAGLVSVPIFVMGLVWILCGAVTMPRGARIRAALIMLLAALTVFSLWVAPVIANYVRFNGFVDITPRLGIEWPVGEALWSWGLLLPAAVFGLVLAVRRRTPAADVLLAFLAGSLVVLAVAGARAEYDWDLGGNETLLHQGRVWPVAHLLAAAFAGVALAFLFRVLAKRSSRLATLAAALFLAVAAASPAVASIYLTKVIAVHEEGYLYRRPDFDNHAFVARAARQLESSDVIDVRGSDFLGFVLFSLTGARLAHYDDERLAGNDLRIRYETLAQQWDDRMAAGGFDADYTIMRASDHTGTEDPIVVGVFRDERWVMVADP